MSLSQSATKSSIQVLFGSFSGRLFNLISLFIVTPILGPEGFGQLLIVGIIVGVFNTVIDIGFENYYIIKVKLQGEDKTSKGDVKMIEDVVFNLRLYSNIILFVAQISISYIGNGVLFSSPVDLYLRILAFNYLAGIFGRINEVRLKKRMDFKSVTRSKILGDLFGSITKVLLVLAGFGIVGWAYGYVAGTIVTTIVLAISGNYKPNIIAIPAKWRKEVIWFAKHSWLTGFGYYLHNQASNIILKSYFPLSQAGYVQFSNAYTLEIQSGLLSSQMQVLLPYFANNQHEPLRIRRGINQYIEASFFLLGFPAIFGFVFGKELIQVFFGEKWLPAYPVFMMYCGYALVRILFAPALSMLTSLGKMKQTTMLAYFNFALCTISLLLAIFISKDIYWYSFVFVIVSLIAEGIKSIWGLSFLKISIFQILQDCSRNILCLAITAVTMAVLHYFMPATNLVQITLVAAVGGLSFLASQFLINHKIFGMFLEKVKMFKTK
jgi:O-antigen/teichoic acid export membrane protein